MGPKAKKSKSEWMQCEICYVRVNQKDSAGHAIQCEEKNPFVADHFPRKVPHGFVFCEQLVGKCVLKDYSEGFSTRQHKGFVFINPQTMKMIGVYIGHPVVAQHRQVFLAWPDNTLSLTDLGLSVMAKDTLDVESGDGIILYSYHEAHVSASEIILKSSENTDFLSTFQFSQFTSKQLDNQFITSGNRVQFSYSGKPCHLTVSRVSGEDGTAVSENDCQSENAAQATNIVEKLVELNLNIDSTNKYEKKYMEATRKHTRFYKISARTKIIIQSPLHDRPETKGLKSFDNEDFGGYSKQVKQIKDMLNLLFKEETEVGEIGQIIEVPRGVLIYGPSGCGKTMLCKTLTQCFKVNTVDISGSDIWSKFHGETEMNLSRMFKEAKDRAPSVVFMDDIDSLCPKRDSSNSDVEKRVTSTILTLMDDLLSSGRKVFILASTSKRDSIDPALRRPGRLDREIELPVPTASDRFEILKKILSREGVASVISDGEIKGATDNAHGYVGADLAVLCKEAFMQSVRRSKKGDAKGEKLHISLPDLEYALSVVQPSAMREVAIEVPQVKWEDIGGQYELKHKLKQAIEWPIKHPEAFQRLGITPPKGLLMYGPPGCSKTMIAKALARESGVNFIAIKGPELFSKWVGESERAVREVFRKARSAAPAIVFFDEIDALAGERGGHGGGGGDVSDRVLAQLLTEIDGVEALHDVTVVAATNRPDRIDKALLRPGRLDRIVYVPLPDNETRAEILRIQFRKMPISDDVSLEGLVDKTERYSGAEVTAICREAALHAMQEDISLEYIHKRHFEQSLCAVTPRITDELIAFYTNFSQNSSLHSI